MSLTTTTVLAVLLMATTLSAQGRDLQPRQEAADILSLALQTRDEPGVRQAARVAAARLPEDSRLRRMLQSTADTPTIENDRLMTRLASIRDDLAFKPVLEASVPTGFPAVAPVGEIVVKDYPRYRLARTRAGAGEGMAFWTLFAHIQSRDIAMTAPVEMTYDESDLDQTAMAFLYGDLAIGQTGAAGRVEVVDVEPIKTVSLGLRGRRSDAILAKAHEALTRWLNDHPDYELAGSLRVMGYNGPMVPVDRRFYEVELPIKRATSDLKL